MLSSMTTGVPRLRRAQALSVLVAMACLLAAVVVSPAAAEDLTAEQEALARKIEGKLIAPC